MEMVLIGAGVLVLLVIGFWFLSSRKKKVLVYHVGAVIEKQQQLEGQKFMLYGFIRPVYGTMIKIRGLGGIIKGSSATHPAQGVVMQGQLKNGRFIVETIVKEVPSSWELEYVSPKGGKTIKTIQAL